MIAALSADEAKDLNLVPLTTAFALPRERALLLAACASLEMGGIVHAVVEVGPPTNKHKPADQWVEVWRTRTGWMTDAKDSPLYNPSNSQARTRPTNTTIRYRATASAA